MLAKCGVATFPRMHTLRVLGTLDLTSPDPAAAKALLAKTTPTALLIFLAVEGLGRFVRRDRLVGLFWPETGQEQARANLRKLLHVIRTACGDELIETRGDEEIRLAPGLISCDVVDFARAVRGGSFVRALELYEGPFLVGFHVSGAPAFAQWADGIRMQTARDAAKAAVALAESHLVASERTAATDLVRTIQRVAPDLDDERLIQKLLMILERAGDKAGALRLYESFARRLGRDYSTTPSGETRAIIERIRLA